MEAVMPTNGQPFDKSAKPQQQKEEHVKKEFDRKLMAEEMKDLRWLPIAEINVHFNTIVIDGHKGYQRSLNPHKIEKMVDEFDPREITAIVVSQRADGRYWVIDGQHRLEALKMLGKQIILADVRTGMTIPEEAILFVRLNAGTTRVGAWDQFQARLSGNDPVATSMYRIMVEHGYHLDRSGNSTKGVAAVRSLEKVYKRGYLPDVMAIISTVWRSDRRATDGPIVEGLAIFLHSYKGQSAFEFERLLDVLAITPPSEILQRQRQLVVEMGRGNGQPAITVAMAIRDVFNGKRRSARKLTGPPISGTGKSLGYPGRVSRAKDKE
jgi:hypothetical protein